MGGAEYDRKILADDVGVEAGEGEKIIHIAPLAVDLSRRKWISPAIMDQANAASRFHGLLAIFSYIR
jgi:hypothetical protein